MICTLGCVVFFMGLRWGLPGRGSDRFLFGTHPVWSGEEILNLLPKEQGDADRPSDVAEEVAEDRSRAIVVNATDAQRARIVRRFRLFSYQPDEVITFMALGKMKPSVGDFDPRLYQYGGLWIYPVGALLKISSLLHLVVLKSDPAFYLDHPEEFGKFYVVARAYTSAWAIVGIVIVFGLAKEMGGNLLVQCAAALGFVFLPVVVYTAHEAKPHLPGAVLAMLVVLMGMQFVRGGRRRFGVLMVVCCGLACGMVLTNLPLLILIPVVFVLRSAARGDGMWRGIFRGLLGIVAAIAVYLVVNPYVLIDLFVHRARLTASVGNTAAMYHFSLLAAIGNAMYLLIAGVSWPVFILGIMGMLAMMARGEKKDWMLVAAVILMAGPYVVFAAGKPAEYGRFGLLPDLVLLFCAVRLLGSWPRRLGMGTMAIMIIWAASGGLAYWRGYLLDERGDNTRMQLAENLARCGDEGTVTLGLSADPAPYCTPAMNLFDWKWVVLPRGQSVRAGLGYDISLAAVDTSPTPMSWANKQFVVYRGNGR